ncbi:MAG: class I SAM-dependent methyltransferase [Methylotenera sp.]
MLKLALRKWLPNRLYVPLWGDRLRWGLTINEADPCWQEWQKTYGDFYRENQREGIGTKINDAGYSVMSQIDLTGKTVLEIGAGDIRHIQYWQGLPREYILADVNQEMMNKAQNRLDEKGVNYRSILLERSQNLPIPSNSVDVIVSFYSLEHLYPLAPYLADMYRVLKPGGTLIGAIPSEGGFAWGAGRMITSRRWFKKNTTIDPDKIICWEHPNFADEIISALDKQFQRQQLLWWPMRLPVLDINLIIQYCYTKN